MNFRQTAEVAALVSANADYVIRRKDPISPHLLHAYWKSSRARLKGWLIGLEAARLERAIAPVMARRREKELGREILMAELLTRVWSAVLAAHDEHRGERAAGPIGRRVFLGHLEARRQVLAPLISSRPSEDPHLASLDRLRRRIERWTDLLLGPLVRDYDVIEFAFDEARAREFANEASDCLAPIRQQIIGDLILAGLRSSVPAASQRDDSRAALELVTLRSILAMFPAEAFGVAAAQNRNGTAAQAKHTSRSAGDPAPSGPSAQPAQTPGLDFTQLRRHRSAPPRDDSSDSAGTSHRDVPPERPKEGA